MMKIVPSNENDAKINILRNEKIHNVIPGR